MESSPSPQGIRGGTCCRTGILTANAIRTFLRVSCGSHGDPFFFIVERDDFWRGDGVCAGAK